MQKYYVYALIDPTDDTIFYIGKGFGRRAYRHSQETEDNTENKRKFNKIQSIRDVGKEPTISFLYVDLTEDEAYNIEEELIKEMGRIWYDTDGVLTNICVRAIPPGMNGRKHTEETKIKMRETRIKWLKQHPHSKIGTKLSKETKQLIRYKKLLQGCTLTEDGRKRIGEASSKRNKGENNYMFGKKHTEESRKKMSESQLKWLQNNKHPMKGKSHSQKSRKKMSLTRRGKTGKESNSSKNWVLQTPNDERIQAHSLRDFCRTNDLAYDALKRTLKTQRKVVKGPSKGWMVLSMS